MLDPFSLKVLVVVFAGLAALLWHDPTLLEQVIEVTPTLG